MTSVSLFGLIAAAVAVQAIVWLLLRARRVRAVLQQAPAVSDSRLALRVIGSRLEDPDGGIRSLHLASADGRPLPTFLPGQFITLVLEGTPAVRRCYSLSDRPGQPHYRISVKRLADGVGSQRVHDRIQVGDVLQARAPSGGFHLQEGDAAVVLIAGGVGITPMVSMLAHLRATQPQRPVWLLYGVRHGGEDAFRDELDALGAGAANVRIERWFSAPRDGDVEGMNDTHRGRITTEDVLARLPDMPYDVYLCGPGAMMADLTAGLQAGGVPDSAVHLEAFGPASVAGSAAGAVLAAGPQAVTFARSKKTVQWQGKGTLLELAETSGIDLPFACRSGSCGTCQTRLRSGEVRYPQPPEHTPAAGSCLPCVCHPSTDVTLDA